MTRDEFDALVKQLEEVSRRNPRRFVARIMALLALAYGYLGVVLLGSLAILIGTLIGAIAFHNVAVIKLGLFVILAAGGIFWAVMRGLWVKLEPPQGTPVTREQAPVLFELLDELRAALDCRPFHQVLLVPEHNAAVVQIPRLGIFGWHRNYLLLGLPLMQSLGPDEFKAVLAYEFAHSSRGHGRFGNWLYRLRRSWERIFEQMARQRTRGGFVLFKFLNWFWPLFNAHAFVLARANEYEADACSVRLAGADAAARALMRLPVDDSLLHEKFWPHIFSLANKLKEPPDNVMVSLGQALKAGLPQADAARRLRQAFLMETNNNDTHPCLKDRLRAIGRLPAGMERGEFHVAPTSPRNAAEHFLGSHADEVAREMSGEWQKAIAPNWAARHQQTQKLAAELAALEKPAGTPASVEELWAKARKLMELHDDAAAAPVLAQVLELDPKHAAANFVRGRLHLEKDDPVGIAFMESALEADPMLTPDGCNLLYAHFTRTGQRDKLRSLEDRVERFQEQAALAQQERSNVTTLDTFVAHALTSAQLAGVHQLFTSEPEIGSAAIVRKQVRLFPQNPAFVVALRINVSWWKPRSSAASQNLVRRVVEKLELPGQFLVFVDEQNLKSLAKKIFALPNSVVYVRLPTS